MDELIAALEAEVNKMQQTIEVVRTLKPIQRQQDACVDLLREHVGAMALIVAPPAAGAAAPKQTGGEPDVLPGGEAATG